MIRRFACISIPECIYARYIDSIREHGI
jgi:hypothetical protein